MVVPPRVGFMFLRPPNPIGVAGVQDYFFDVLHCRGQKYELKKLKLSLQKMAALFQNHSFIHELVGQNPLVEVTLQAIRGITLRTREDGTNIIGLCRGEEINGRVPRMPWITAAVAFSGSVDDMQVSSSFICPKSAKLMVESRPATLLPSTDYPLMNTYPLIAQFTDLNDEDLMKDVLQPHLSIRVPTSDSRVPKIPLSQMNRDSNIIQSSPRSRSSWSPSLDESDVSSQSGELGGFEVGPTPSRDDTRSETRESTSVVWSASGAAMPEIIELHVSLKIDEDDAKNTRSGESDELEVACDSWRETIFPIGTAFLVFFGNDEGRTVIDLPIKKNFGSQLAANGSVSLDDNASIRIMVDVMPQGKIGGSPFNSFIDLYSSDMIDAASKARIYHDQRVLWPILEQLKKAERTISRPKQRLRKDLERHADGHGAPPLYPREFRASRMLCNLGSLDIFSTISAAVKCGDAGGFIPRSNSMSSTIDTALSLEI